MEFGERLRRLREARGMKQAEVALAAKMSNTYLSDLENGRKSSIVPSGDTVIRLADALHTSADYLLGRTDDIEPPTPAAKSTQTIEERLVELERMYRSAGYSEHDIELIMSVARRVAPPAQCD